MKRIAIIIMLGLLLTAVVVLLPACNVPDHAGKNRKPPKRRCRLQPRRLSGLTTRGLRTQRLRRRRLALPRTFLRRRTLARRAETALRIAAILNPYSRAKWRCGRRSLR